MKSAAYNFTPKPKTTTTQDSISPHQRLHIKANSSNNPVCSPTNSHFQHAYDQTTRGQKKYFSSCQLRAQAQQRELIGEIKTFLDQSIDTSAITPIGI